MPLTTGAPPSPTPALNADADAFLDVQAVLAGELHVELDGDSSKMLRVLLETATNAVITPERFVVYFHEVERRRPAQYFPRLAPPALGALLRRAGLARVCDPVVLQLPAGDFPRFEQFTAWTFASRLVWIDASPAAVNLAVRPGSSLQTPRVSPIPVDGPLAYPRTRPWRPAPERWRTFDPPRACPHCGAAADCYREITAALACPACHRSFPG